MYMTQLDRNWHIPEQPRSSIDSSGAADVLGMLSIEDLVEAVIQDQQTLTEQMESCLAR
jgi:hypothetical protein